MATRSIVTSQPDVACDVCERRLLRGEQPDAFLAAGRRRIVCELCAPRAVQEGWLRETGGQSLSLPALRTRRGRNFFGRLRQAARPAEGSEHVPRAVVESAGEQQSGPYDFLDGYAGGVSVPVPARPREPAGTTELAQDGRDLPMPEAVPEVDPQLARALAAFNAGEHPRRVAGVARSLGAPVVNVRVSEHARSVIAIVIAWELCWYRYEVDLDESPAEARVLAQGTELGELAPEDRLANAMAEESGTLLLASV